MSFDKAHRLHFCASSLITSMCLKWMCFFLSENNKRCLMSTFDYSHMKLFAVTTMLTFLSISQHWSLLFIPPKIQLLIHICITLVHCLQNIQPFGIFGKTPKKMENMLWIHIHSEVYVDKKKRREENLIWQQKQEN